MMYSKKSIIFIATVGVIAASIFVVSSNSVQAQAVNSMWKLISGVLQPVVSTYKLKIPYLGGSGTKCIHVDNNGLFGTTSADCGSGSGTSYFTNSGSDTYLNTGSNLQAPYFTATSTTATSTFNGPIMIDDDESLSIGNPTGGALNFTYGVIGSLYTSDGSNWGVNVYACKDSDRGNRVCSATPLNITGTDLNNSSPMALTYSWNAVTGAEWYRVYLYNSTSQYPDYCDPVNYDCYLDTVSNSVHLGEGAEEDQTVDPTLSGVYPGSPASFTGLALDVRGRSYFSNYVGIGTTSPYAALSVAGQAVADYFTGTSTATSTFAGDISFENAYATVIPLQDTASNLSSIVPLSGQTVYETDTTYTKVGDGVTTVGNLLPTAHIYYTTSNVGVGTTSPYAKLSVAGQVVGEYYTATSTTATSTFSGNVVIGTPRVMAGGSFVTGAFASGYSNTTRDTINSNGKGSFATGYVSSSFGTSSITATGNGAVAIGSVDSSPGGSILATAGSIVVGSAVNGRILKSVGSGSYAGGRAASGDVVSSGTGSFIWGDNATSSGSLSIAFGSGYTNSTNNTFTVGFSSSPTLTVNSTNVGIGTTSPYAKLSVAGQVVADYYTATSTTATSTFSGNVNVIGNGIKFEYLSAPSAPTVALAGAGAGNVNNGSHIYSMTCVTEEGETENSSTNSVTVTDKTTNGKVTVTVPVCSHPSTVARKIWRGVANNAFSVYLLTTINDNTTTSYTDNTADASLGNRTPEPTSGPQGGKTGVNTTAGTLRLGDSNTIKINQYGGMNFSSPNASLVFPQNAIKPIVLYNTSNQEQSAAGTGVEYGSMYYSGNILHLGHFIGTVGGSSREVQIHSNGQGSNFYMSLYRGQTAPKGWFDFAESGGTSIGGLTFARFNPDTWTASAGTNTLLNLSGTINMSGTAGYRMLDIAPSETTTGSGEKRLIRAAVNGNELMVLDSMGRLGIGTTTSLTSQLTVSATTTNATSTITIGKPGQNKGSCLELYDAGGSVVYAYVKPGDTTFTLSTVSCK